MELVLNNQLVLPFFYQYVWESEQEVAVKDDLLLFAARPLYPIIFCSSNIFVPSCENPSPDVYTSDHSQNAQDVTLSFDCGEDKYFFPNPLDLSYFLSGDSGGDIFCFSSTPL